MEGSVTRHQGVMNERESIEAFVECSKSAASAAREMAKEFTDKEWAETANMLDAICNSGLELSKMRSMSRLETMMAANIKTGLIGQ